MTSGERAPSPGAVEGLNAHETRYLHEEIFVRRHYFADGMELPEHSVVLDVGANIGMYSLFAASVCPTATLYAFEPVPPVFETLRRNLAACGVPATAFPFGLSDRDAAAEFVFYPGYSIMSAQREQAAPAVDMAFVKRRVLFEAGGELGDAADFLDEMVAYRFRERVCAGEVRRLSTVLDELGLRRVDMLKIDVQRAEAAVLRGVDDRHWPLIRRIAVEVHDEPETATRGRLAAVVAELRGRGMDILDVRPEQPGRTDRSTVFAARVTP